MRSRRMFSSDILCTDTFLDMPVSARDLYVQLGMRADDDGFVQPKVVMRMVGASEDDLKILIAKKFIIPFESGVIVIRHWRQHNTIRADRYEPTHHREEKRMLALDGNAYVVAQHGNQLAPARQPLVAPSKKESNKVNKGDFSNEKSENAGNSSMRRVGDFVRRGFRQEDEVA